MRKRNKTRISARAATQKSIRTMLLCLALCLIVNTQSTALPYSGTGTIVIDAGHGGIDGGAGRNGLLEKHINLTLAKKLKTLLETKGYTIVMTRDQDISLDNLSKASTSRHKRDLIARTGIINASSAQFFISLHVNSLTSDSAENGSIVYYSRRFPQSQALADFVQKELNALKINGARRKQQKPLINRYYVLGCSTIPGILIETAFISNSIEKELLKTEAFLDELTAAVAEGTDRFLRSEERVVHCRPSQL
jgi:N-acetylmuramoyl-L-alanine amidase